MSGPDDLSNANPLKHLQSNNYFERLGLPRAGASDADVKSAFRELAKRYHPDLNPGDKVAEESFKLVTEAYENLKIGITMKTVTGHGHRPRRENREFRTPEDPKTRRRAEELKTQSAEVESFEQGIPIIDAIDKEFKQGERRSELLGYLTRRLQFLLQQRLKEYTDLKSLALLTEEVNEFADSVQGSMLFTSYFTDELDVAALNIGLEMLSRANTKQEIDRAQAEIAQYPFTFTAISEVPVMEGKEDAMTRIKLLRKIQSMRPRTLERLDRLLEEVKEQSFIDQKRASQYREQILKMIERHRKVYYPDGVFVPLRESTASGDDEKQ